LVNFFAHSRTALWQGLQQLPMEKGQTILVPDYICDVVLHPLEDLGIQPEFYPVDDYFAPYWEVLENIQTDCPAQAFLLVHYFGQPQDIKRAREFCDKYGLWMIEDNAHGHGGKYNRKILGSFGDIGFSSPHKQLQSASGGVLYLHGKPADPISYTLPVYPVSRSKEVLRRVFRRFPKLKARIHKILKPHQDFTNPSAFPEIKMKYHVADPESVRRIINMNWYEHAAFRRKAWNAW